VPRSTSGIEATQSKTLAVSWQEHDYSTIYFRRR